MKKKIAAIITVAALLFSAFPAQAATVEELANSTELKPTTVGFAELDAQVEAALAKVIKPEMTNYQKLKAIYDYNVTSWKYQGHSIYLPAGSAALALQQNENANPKGYATLLHAESCIYAWDLFKTKEGVCESYAATFASMANAAGFEAHVINGNILLNSGKWNGHTWVLVKLGDSYYIFDPQAEQLNIRNNTIRYMNFGLSASTAKYVSFDNELKNSQVRRKAYLERSSGGAAAANDTAEKVPFFFG